GVGVFKPVAEMSVDEWHTVMDTNLTGVFYCCHAALPLLRQRWPHAADALARSAALCAEAAELLAAGDAAALEAVRRDADTLDVPGLLALPAPRRARVLRRWVAELGLPPLPGAAPARIGAELLAAPGDAGARYDWAGARLQRWRDLLHGGLLPPTLPPGWSCAWDGRAPLALPTGDTLRLHGAPGFDLTLRVHGRGGGERIVLPGRRHSHALKHALQDAGVPPWQRRRLPLLSDGGELLAAGDAIVSARLHAWLLARGARLEWRAALRGLPRRAW
ncbi:MAG TPA: tRNA lysidine(34) synthetase TilS, partial [Thermomonas sp.]|nr:tRNA lysidine(34) synthetase TilS [Thermomonas sp.]